MTAPESRFSADSLDPVFRPRSVTIIGASDDVTRISGRTMRYLRDAGYAGEVYPVNPRRDTVQGVKAYAAIADLPVVPDLAILALPSSATKDAVAECAKKGIKAAIIFTSGFAEMGEEGRKEQEELAAIAKAAGMRLLGPNCVGVFNTELRFYGTFTQSLDVEFPADGPVGVVSQSGAFGGHLLYLAKQRNLGFRYWCSTGNEADIGVAEAIHWMANRPEIKVILVYAEGIRDGDGLIEAFRAAHANRKAIVLLKVGRSEAGAIAASSHTAALAGADAVYDAVFRQFGVYRARTTEECVDIAYAAAKGVFPPGNRVGLVSVSGGAGVQMCDAAELFGLDVAPMPEESQKKLQELLPFAAVRNPIDTTAQIQNDMGLLTKNLEIMLEEGGYDSVVGFFTSLPNSRAFGQKLKESIIEATQSYKDRLIVLSLLGPAETIRSYEDAGFLVFQDADRAVEATAALTRIGQAFAQTIPPAPQAGKASLTAAMGALSEFEAKKILREHGIPALPEELVSTPDEAGKAAEAMGYPVVLKIVSPDILHKTEIGGVLLNLKTREDVMAGATAILARAKAAHPTAQIEGLLVAPMAPKGVETIIGVTRDPVFGPMVMFGLGGVLVEVLKDVTFRRAPFDETEALRMIGEIKAHAVLEGVRGALPSDIPALAKALAAISRFAADNADVLDSIDINPFLVLPEGQGAMALDAVVLTRDA